MPIFIQRFLITTIGLINMLPIFCTDIELGRVQWSRDLEQSRIKSRTDKKDILILFQEIPGCGTCKNYGKSVLSHPLVVEAIEDLFIPVVVYNNKQGRDREILEFFNEPSWNNPVIRVVDSELKDVCERLSGNYTSYGLVSKIIAALQKRNKKIPEYLLLLEEEFLALNGGIQTAYLGMYCFWSGEKCFAKAPGVVATKAGFMNGSEVVEVKYNPKKINLSTLIQHGKEMNCADRIFTNNAQETSGNRIESRNISEFNTDKESKYYIYNTNYKYIPMTELQALRLNLALSQNGSADSILSPRQIQLFKKISNHMPKGIKNVIGIPIEEIWYKLTDKM